MTCENILTGIIIPIVSALIGGLVTMLGVILTIRNEKKKDEEKEIKASKPWIFSLDSREIYDSLEANEIHLSANGSIMSHPKIGIVIKNTDNGTGIVEKIKSKNNEYYPVVGKVLDKNKITEVIIHLTDNETLQDMFLYIHDIYGNPYVYEIAQDSRSKKHYSIKEVSIKK